MVKPVVLSVHKNTAARHKAKEIRAGIKAGADWAMRNLDGNLTGYTLVMWSDKDVGKAFWDGKPIHGFVEDHSATILRREIAMRDAQRLFDPQNEES